MWKNRELKLYTIKYLICFFFIGIILFFAIKYAITHMEELYFMELLETNSDKQSLVESGKMSYLPSQYSDSIRSSIVHLYLLVYLVYMLLAVCGYCIGLSLYKSPLNAIKQVTANSENVLDGSYEGLEISGITEGDISHFYSMYTKMVTTIKQSRDKEKEEKIFLQDLIADISHQLKTPLATLTIYQDLLCNPNVAEVKKQEMLQLMGKQLSRMEWLILSLLKLARLESGSIQFEIVSQPLLPTIQMAVQNVHILSAAKNQTITVSCDDKLLLAHDSDWLSEALTNILKNATEYAPTDSSIEVFVEQSAVMTMIHIKDYGKGIDKDSINKIFKRFYRAKSDVNENSIGIGLSLSKGIVEGQNGDITVTSQPGKYTCFSVNFYHTSI